MSNFIDYINESSDEKLAEAAKMDTNNLWEMVELLRQPEYKTKKDFDMLDWSEVSDKDIKDINNAVKVLIKHFEF